MSEVQVNAVLSTQSADTVDSTQSRDANGNPIVSKSKARSLRRKRAKQRKKAAMQNGGQGVEEKKTEPQDKENSGAQQPKGQAGAKKKKRHRKKKNKAQAGDGAKPDAIKNNNGNKVRSSSAATSKNVEPKVTASTKLSESAKPKVTASTSEITKGTEETSPAKIDDLPVREETIAPVATSVEIKSDTTQATIYDDDNENNIGEKEDCACACTLM
ncbi:unnamed protein product [Pseudo-nitzschia multistriata]|uniref:Uncharacterized protein n=1 Tax=Pseudo-nitzschia multistriata TaxID=183589 RepID=A0A448YWC7_9STRA|nr:unnamed protein product [Pseudo-nitzschia multistriata]